MASFCEGIGGFFVVLWVSIVALFSFGPKDSVSPANEDPETGVSASEEKVDDKDKRVLEDQTINIYDLESCNSQLNDIESGFGPQGNTRPKRLSPVASIDASVIRKVANDIKGKDRPRYSGTFSADSDHNLFIPADAIIGEDRRHRHRVTTPPPSQPQSHPSCYPEERPRPRPPRSRRHQRPSLDGLLVQFPLPPNYLPPNGPLPPTVSSIGQGPPKNNNTFRQYPTLISPPPPSPVISDRSTSSYGSTVPGSERLWFTNDTPMTSVPGSAESLTFSRPPPEVEPTRINNVEIPFVLPSRAFPSFTHPKAGLKGGVGRYHDGVDGFDADLHKGEILNDGPARGYSEPRDFSRTRREVDKRAPTTCEEECPCDHCDDVCERQSYRHHYHHHHPQIQTLDQRSKQRDLVLDVEVEVTHHHKRANSLVWFADRELSSAKVRSREFVGIKPEVLQLLAKPVLPLRIMKKNKGSVKPLVGSLPQSQPLPHMQPELQHVPQFEFMPEPLPRPLPPSQYTPLSLPQPPAQQPQPTPQPRPRPFAIYKPLPRPPQGTPEPATPTLSVDSEEEGSFPSTTSSFPEPDSPVGHHRRAVMQAIAKQFREIDPADEEFRERFYADRAASIVSQSSVPDDLSRRWAEAADEAERRGIRPMDTLANLSDESLPSVYSQDEDAIPALSSRTSQHSFESMKKSVARILAMFKHPDLMPAHSSGSVDCFKIEEEEGEEVDASTLDCEKEFLEEVLAMGVDGGDIYYKDPYTWIAVTDDENEGEGKEAE